MRSTMCQCMYHSWLTVMQQGGAWCGQHFGAHCLDPSTAGDLGWEMLQSHIAIASGCKTKEQNQEKPPYFDSLIRNAVSSVGVLMSNWMHFVSGSSSWARHKTLQVKIWLFGLRHLCRECTDSLRWEVKICKAQSSFSSMLSPLGALQLLPRLCEISWA